MHIFKKVLVRRAAYFLGFIGVFIAALNADNKSERTFPMRPTVGPVPVAHADTPPVYAQGAYSSYSQGSYYGEGYYYGQGSYK